MNCTRPSCGKSWNEGDEAFPLCITSPCPLRAYRDERLEKSMGKSIFSTTPTVDYYKKSACCATAVEKSFTTIRGEFSDDIVKYDMDGAQSATTEVLLPNKTVKKFRTTNQMHSEMRAIEWMLEEGHWILSLGLILWKDGRSVSGKEFSTSEPHCGFCTIFLAALGLPLSTPTCGNYQLASRLSYPLPVRLEIDPWFMARVLDSGSYSGFHMIKRVLNIFVNVPAGKWVLNINNLAWVNDHHYVTYNPNIYQVFWQDLVNQRNRETIWAIWKYIFNAILTSNKKS